MKKNLTITLDKKKKMDKIEEARSKLLKKLEDMRNTTDECIVELEESEGMVDAQAILNVGKKMLEMRKKAIQTATATK